MDLSGIGGNGAGAGSALDKFQKLRDAAQKKLDGADRQAGLAELIQRKQKQLGTGGASPASTGSQAERIPPGPGLLAGPAGPVAPGKAGDAGAGQNAGPAAPISAAYGRSGTPRKQDAAPRLGRYVDFLA